MRNTPITQPSQIGSVNKLAMNECKITTKFLQNVRRTCIIYGEQYISTEKERDNDLTRQQKFNIMSLWKFAIRR